jgi:hypothetical protein
MAESDRAVRNGERVQEFFLLPEHGNLLHPAHRFGDQMIAVHLQEKTQFQFSAGALVWVWGMLRGSPGDPAGSQPLYNLERARVQPAGESDIRKYFK